MKKLLEKLKGKPDRSKRRGDLAGDLWMREQLTRMQKMNQGVISMSGGK